MTELTTADFWKERIRRLKLFSIFQKLPRTALQKLLLYAARNATFQCFYGNGTIFKKTQTLAVTVNFLFWPILSLIIMWIAVTIDCYRETISMKKVSGRALRFFQLACEEGDVEKLSKYLVSHYMKTPLDEKCNLHHFRQNPKIDINDKDNRNWSSMRCAILGRKYKLTSKAHLQCIELLLIHGVNVQDDEFLTDSLEREVVYLYSEKPNLKWYALSLTRILLASGCQMNRLSHKKLISFLLKEAVCNESEQNVEEQFMRTWGCDMFPRKDLAQEMDELDINVDDLKPEFRQRASNFITDISDYSTDVESLKHLCRLKVRQHLMEQHPDRNLYFLVSQTPLPVTMVKYLLFGLKPPKLSYYDYTTLYCVDSFV